jgi:hypothetical protein
MSASRTPARRKPKTAGDLHAGPSIRGVELEAGVVHAQLVEDLSDHPLGRGLAWS